MGYRYDLLCYETMEPNCRNEENHSVVLDNAQRRCNELQASQREAAERLNGAVGQALDARRLLAEADQIYAEHVRARDLANSLVETFSGQPPPLRDDYASMEALAAASGRTAWLAGHNAQRAETCASTARAAQDCAEGDHRVKCDLCCFRVKCGDCGISLR